MVLGRHCIRSGCKEAAKYVPKISVPLAGLAHAGDAPYVAIIPDMELCLVHVNQVNPSHFTNLQAVFGKQMGGNAVDWSRVSFSKVEIDSQEYKALNAGPFSAPPPPPEPKAITQ